VSPPEAEQIQNTFVMDEPIAEVEEEVTSPAHQEDGDDVFSDLTRSAFEAQQQHAAAAEARAAEDKARAKEDAKLEREMAKKVADLEKKAAKRKSAPSAPKKAAAAAADDSDSVFGEQGSEILGRDKRQLITKITQYKQLFPKELKGFKVKKNATPQELRAYLDEMSCIVETGTLDEFITESILGCLKMVEGISSYTQNFNISGLADMLKMNPQFNNLVKQLYIKYNTFDAVPPEQQLIILVATTSYICIQKNKNRAKLESYLNEPAVCPFVAAGAAP
jgi:hypothetical protein